MPRRMLPRLGREGAAEEEDSSIANARKVWGFWELLPGVWMELGERKQLLLCFFSFLNFSKSGGFRGFEFLG